jgi:hypothetical protein
MIACLHTSCSCLNIYLSLCLVVCLCLCDCTDLSVSNVCHSQMKAKGAKRPRGVSALDRFTDEQLAAAKALVAEEEATVRAQVEVSDSRVFLTQQYHHMGRVPYLPLLCSVVVRARCRYSASKLRLHITLCVLIDSHGVVVSGVCFRRRWVDQ